MSLTDLKPIWDFFVELSKQVGLGAVFFVFGLHKGWWVMGAQHRELRGFYQRLFDVAEINAKVADTGLEIAKR